MVGDGKKKKNLAVRNYLQYVEMMNDIDANWSPLYIELNEIVKAASNSKQASKKTDTPTETPS